MSTIELSPITQLPPADSLKTDSLFVVVTDGVITEKATGQQVADFVTPFLQLPPGVPAFVGSGSVDAAATIQDLVNAIPVGELGTIRVPKPDVAYRLDSNVEQNGRYVSFEFEPGVTFTGDYKINGSLNRTVQRFNNRVFIGLATNENDGREFWETVEKDWVEKEVGSTTSTDELVVISGVGLGAIMAASRTSDNPLEQSQGTRGVGAITIADKIGEYNAYTFYGESRRHGNAGWSHAAELDLISRPGVVSGHEAITTPILTPNSPFTNQSLTGPWISVGRPDVDDCGDASVGLAFINNAGARRSEAGRLRVGILFDQTSILGLDGDYAGNAFGTAIALGRRHQIAWYNEDSGDTPASFISMSADSADAPCIEFANGGTIFRNPAGSWSMVIEQSAIQDGAVHIAPGTASSPALLFVASPAGGIGTRDFEIAAFKGTVKLQGTKEVTAFAAYSETGHGAFVQATANAAGFSPKLEAISSNPNEHLTIKGQGTGTVIIPGLPTSAAGLPTGALWNDTGTVKVV